MKILLVTEFFPTGKNLRFSGGVEARTYFVGTHLAKKNKVYVICTHQYGSRRREQINGINILRVGPTSQYSAGSSRMSPFKLFGYIYAAIKEGRELNADIVDGGNFIAHFIARLIARGKNLPVVFWYPDVFLGQWVKTSGVLNGIIGSFLEKLNLKLGSDKYIAISNVTKQKLLKSGVMKSKISVVPCGVEKSEFKVKVSKSDMPTILCVSRLVKYKRVEDLVWAFAMLIKKSYKSRLLIVGQGPELKKLQKISSMLSIEKEVRFTGNLSRKDLIKYYKSSHIFCLPSEIEGFGISVIEAAAAGLPYVISNIAVFREITKNGVGGLIAKSRDRNELFEKLKMLLTDKKLYEKKFKESNILSDLYDWKKITHETENIYKSLV